jgi:hypothetical protein
VSGAGSVTSFSPSINASATYYAEARNTTTGCVSETRLAVGAYVGNPAAAGQAADPMCGCESALSNCSGTCKACCGWADLCSTFNERYPSVAVGGKLLGWTIASESCYALGTGWRLPTKTELQCIIAHKECLDGLYYEANYWTYTYSQGSEHYSCYMVTGECVHTANVNSMWTTCVK